MLSIFDSDLNIEGGVKWINKVVETVQNIPDKGKQLLDFSFSHFAPPHILILISYANQALGAVLVLTRTSTQI